MDAKQILEQCAREEEALRFPAFTQTDALALGNLIYQKSLDKEAPAAIEIRMNRQTIFSFFPCGTNENNRLWLAAKARTVDMTQHSSLRFWAEIQLSGKRPEERRMPEAEFACCGGGFPLTLKNCGVVGTICVSGLPHMQDHALVVEALEAYLKDQ